MMGKTYDFSKFAKDAAATADLNRWAREGRAAKRAGKGRDANPYKEGSEAASRWALGYNHADERWVGVNE